MVNSRVDRICVRLFEHILGQLARASSPFLLTTFVFIAALTFSQAQTYTVLHNFNGTPDGGSPFASLTIDSNGNLFGTAAYYGDSSCGCGTVFKIDTSGVFSVLHTFTGMPDGSQPYASLLLEPSGNLYGTTTVGGDSIYCSIGCGTVFQIDATGAEKVLYSFVGAQIDGTGPVAGVVRDSSGTFYGTTEGGGGYEWGTAFRLKPSGKEMVIHTFNNFGDGSSPNSNLFRTTRNTFYGLTQFGGSNNIGTIFELNKVGAEERLISFNGQNGAYPQGGLASDSMGKIYGVTNSGGNSACNPPFGCGTIFRLTQTGIKMIHAFSGGTLDGANPAGILIADGQGNIYGTTQAGGSGFGTVFELSSLGTLTLLHSFSGPDGQDPVGGLVQDQLGNLYGTTSQGGAYGYGVVFEIVP